MTEPTKFGVSEDGETFYCGWFQGGKTWFRSIVVEQCFYEEDGELRLRPDWEYRLDNDIVDPGTVGPRLVSIE